MTLDEQYIEEVSPHDRMAWDDFIAGTLAGVALTLVGHPFDTCKSGRWTTARVELCRPFNERSSASLYMGYCICLPLSRVRLQTQSHLYRSGLHCLKETISKEGLFAVYKGMGGPMLTIPIVNAIVFAAYGQAKAFMLRSQPSSNVRRQISLE